jgi:acetylornithine aminotransferase
MLGTTFGGNHLACAAAIAVLEIFEREGLVDNAQRMGQRLANGLAALPGLRELRGRGLMLGLDMQQPMKELRSQLLLEQNVFTGAAGTHVIRLLPPLCVGDEEVGEVLEKFESLKIL